SGRYALGKRVTETALRRDAANPPSAERAVTLTRAAGLNLVLGDHEAARLQLEEALACWKAIDGTERSAATIAGLAVVAMSQSRFEDAWVLTEECLALYQRQGRTRGAAMALHNLGTIEWALARGDH